MTVGSASEVAIRVEGLSKSYRIGSKQEKYRTMRDTLASVISAPARRINTAIKRTGNVRASKFETIWALKDITFDVKRGEVVGIIGRNGAGKSTLLKILSRITDPSEGFAEIHGRVASLLEVGTGFHPELTGRENIYLNGAILGMRRTEIEHKFDEMVDFAEVEKFIDTPVKYYSSGMYLRLAFAVASHLEPEILVVDEVLAVGDMAFQRKCLGKMGEIAGQGRTVLFVSHNIAAISTLTTRCVLLDHGAIEIDGPTKEVVQQYLRGEQKSQTSNVSSQFDTRDQIFDFLGCQVGSKSEQPTFSSSASIPISIDFKVKHRTIGLRVGFDLITSDGTLAFRTYQDDWDFKPQDMVSGIYKSICTIPPNLLNHGDYYVTLRAGIQAVRKISTIDRALIFTIVNVDGGNSQYGGVRPGVINPQLTWETTAHNAEPVMTK